MNVLANLRVGERPDRLLDDGQGENDLERLLPQETLDDPAWRSLRSNASIACGHRKRRG